MKPTGPYQTDDWDEIVEIAWRTPRLQRVAETYKQTGHPACLNVIMVNATPEIWLAYHRTGKRSQDIQEQTAE